jgi:hypothetical protein
MFGLASAESLDCGIGHGAPAGIQSQLVNVAAVDDQEAHQRCHKILTLPTGERGDQLKFHQNFRGSLTNKKGNPLKLFK